MKWWQQNWDKVILATIIVASLALTYISISECDGTLVRGVFWYECTKG